jgi:hypothetical protein
MDPLFDLSQQSQVRQSVVAAAEAKHDAHTLRQELEALTRKVDGLTLACQALWELLRDTTGLPDKTVFEKMQEIDLRDGTLDGKMGARPVTCAHCGRTTNDHRKSCLYCGEPLAGGDILQRV